MKGLYQYKLFCNVKVVIFVDWTTHGIGLGQKLLLGSPDHKFLEQLKKLQLDQATSDNDQASPDQICLDQLNKLKLDWTRINSQASPDHFFSVCLNKLYWTIPGLALLVIFYKSLIMKHLFCIVVIVKAVILLYNIKVQIDYTKCDPSSFSFFHYHFCYNTKKQWYYTQT